MRLRTLAAVGVVIVAAAAITAPFFRWCTRAAALIVRMAGLQGPAANALGIDERRLYGLAHELAGVG